MQVKNDGPVVRIALKGHILGQFYSNGLGYYFQPPSCWCHGGEVTEPKANNGD